MRVDGGSAERLGRSFVGLADLFVQTEDVPALGKVEGGVAEELVVPKHELSAIADPAWAGVVFDPAELVSALQEPPLLVELAGIDTVPWGDLTHAYGRAVDVPLDLKRVASSDPRLRESALWNLGGNIYHQGSIGDSTAAAVPFLITLAASVALPNRAEVLGLLEVIAESAAVVKPEAIRRRWADRARQFPNVRYTRSPAEMAERQIAGDLATQAAVAAAGPTLGRLCDDADRSVADAARAVVRAFGASGRGNPDAG